MREEDEDVRFTEIIEDDDIKEDESKRLDSEIKENAASTDHHIIKMKKNLKKRQGV